MPKSGSSPQARGTRQERGRGITALRFIPAGAGNTQYGKGHDAMSSVHPRRRGEHWMLIRGQSAGSGSSPQARGTPPSFISNRRMLRFIPAGAGNTASTAAAAALPTVHPRRRGEHVLLRNDCRPVAGSFPQARGTPPAAADCPRQSRFIPAGAGNTLTLAARGTWTAVHPRRRGEHVRRRRLSPAQDGSSPQARGTLKSHRSYYSYYRFIPAGAGNTRRGGPALISQPVHPRRRGEHAQGQIQMDANYGSSPQARGTQWS